MCVISVGRLWVLDGFESQPGEFEFHIGLWLGSSPGTQVQILLHGFKSQSQVDSFNSREGSKLRMCGFLYGTDVSVSLKGTGRWEGK